VTTVATRPGPAPHEPHGLEGAAHASPRVALAQAVVLARRSVVGTLRQPQMWIPSILFPLLIAAVNTAALQRSTRLEGFPDVDSYLDFLLPATVLQGVMFGAISAGSELALDIQNGFFDRLLASPVARLSILVGRLSGAAVLAAVQALVFVLVFLVFGASIAGGLPAVLVLVVTAVLLAVAVGGFGVAIALRSGSQEVVQNFFPLLFVLLYLSSAFFPVALMTGWYHDVASANPLSTMIDGVRALVISGYAGRDALRAVGLSALAAVLALAFALTQLRYRLRAAR
jgi:ABC-2 type transport system permease protein